MSFKFEELKVYTKAIDLAEGSSRKTNEFKHFLDMAKGSCFECVAIIQVAKNNSYINSSIYNEIYIKCEELAKMLSSLKVSLDK